MAIHLKICAQRYSNLLPMMSAVTHGCNSLPFLSIVNVTDLECPAVNRTASNETTSEETTSEETTSEETTQICGSDGNTYSSICNLIQTSVNVEMAYSGPCNVDECERIGEVGDSYTE